MRCPHFSTMKEVTEEDAKALEMRAQGSCDKCEVNGPDHLWACLQKCCTFVGCGKYGNRHIELHNQETEHHLCVELKDYRVWCFSCHSEVDPQSGSSCDEPLQSTNTKDQETLDLGDSSELERELKPRGLCGLMNIGNTCYMNAALQALSNCPPLTQFFLECCSVDMETKSAGVTRSYCNLVTEMWSKKRPKYVVPSHLLRSIRSVNGQFRGYGQQDAQEFLRCIMDQLHEELKQPVFSLPVEQFSDLEAEEPNHQAKRLLGGTSFPAGSLNKDEDVEMISDDEESDKNSSRVSPTPECIQSHQDTLERAETPSELERRASATLDPGDVQLVLDEEEERMSEGETEDEQALIRDQQDPESPEVTSDDDQVLLVNNEQGAGVQSTEDGAKEEKEVIHRGTSPAPPRGKLHKAATNTEPSNKELQPAEKPKIVNYHSIITDIFDGKVQSSVQCLTCNRVSSRIEAFQDLSLPIPGKDELTMIHAAHCAPLVTCTTPATGDGDTAEKRGWVVSLWDWLSRWFFGPQVTLQDCLAAFFSADELKGDNMYSCERCKKLRNGIKYCKVTKLPEVLCIHLKRFRHEMYFSSKINNFITFPLVGLDMRPFLLRDACGDTSQRCTNYDLVAVITHHGSVGAGHYVAFAKNCISGKWYEFNDSWVSEVSDSYVSGIEAYVLFYRKSSDKAVKERTIFSTLMKESEQGSPVRCYISKQWLTKFQHCAEPGPVTNTDFLCVHGAVHPFVMERVLDLVVPIPSSVLQHLITRFGGGPPVMSLEMCQQCKKALEELERRRDHEIETFKKLNDQFLQNDNLDACCISMRWFRLWEMFVKGNKDEPPGPIDNNHILVTKGNQKVLRAGSDYGQVSEETWNFLQDIYGGGPAYVVEAEQSQ